MKKITQSASKLVLLYIIAILGLLALFAGAWSVATGTFGEAAKIILGSFGVALNFVLGFYFGYKGDTPPANTVTSTKVTESKTVGSVEEDQSYAGK